MRCIITQAHVWCVHTHTHTRTHTHTQSIHVLHTSHSYLLHGIFVMEKRHVPCTYEVETGFLCIIYTEFVLQRGNADGGS